MFYRQMQFNLGGRPQTFDSLSVVERAAMWARWIVDSRRSLKHRSNLVRIVKNCKTQTFIQLVEWFVTDFAHEQAVNQRN